MDSKSSLSERDIITKYILPAIEQSGWNKQSQIREEVTFTAGRIFVKGKKTKRGEKKTCRHNHILQPKHSSSCCRGKRQQSHDWSWNAASIGVCKYS